MTNYFDQKYDKHFGQMDMNFKLLVSPKLIYLLVCVICLALKYCNQSTHGMIILHKNIRRTFLLP